MKVVCCSNFLPDENQRDVGMICLEDALVQIDEMGIDYGPDIDRILWLEKLLEKTWVQNCQVSS